MSRFLSVIALFLAALIIPVFAHSDSHEIRARLSQPDSNAAISSVRVGGRGNLLTVVSSQKFSGLGTHVSKVLEGTHSRFEKILGEIPPIRTSVHLLEESTFFTVTGAPKWTNALFVGGKILIPVENDFETKQEDLARSVTHEYVHAIIHSATAGRCPGWLDEGLAQWAEGTAPPQLQMALKDYLDSEPPVPLDLLQGGFTKLKLEMVAPAYAESLFAVSSLLQTYGFSPLREYFERLRDGEPGAEAFEKSFLITESEFEEDLRDALSRWHKKVSSGL